MFKKTLTATVTTIMFAAPAMAELVVPWFAYRTGAYAPSGIPLVDGVNDYFTMVNIRIHPVNSGTRGQSIYYRKRLRVPTPVVRV